MIIEVVGRIFHIHVEAETEDGVQDIAADVAIESSMGLLMITAGGVAVSGSWPDREQWGTTTFEEFLCARTPSWIVGKMMGQDAMIFDEERTRQALQKLCPDKSYSVEEFLDYVDSEGEITEGGTFLADMLSDELDEPVDGFIMMRPTGFAELLIEGVLPKLLEKLAPPPVVKDQTHLKLC